MDLLLVAPMAENSAVPLASKKVAGLVEARASMKAERLVAELVVEMAGPRALLKAVVKVAWTAAKLVVRRDDWWADALAVQKVTQKGGSKVATTAEPRVGETAALMGSLLGSPQAALLAERWAEKRAGK